MLPRIWPHPSGNGSRTSPVNARRFGDTITPGPEQVEYPSLLGFPTPVVSVYPKETVVAEKLQAMVMLGMANSGWPGPPLVRAAPLAASAALASG